MANLNSDRRRFPRSAAIPRFLIGLRKAEGLVSATSVNVSEGGLCLRMRQPLDVRSIVQLSLTPQSGRPAQPMVCAGRVVWVMARQDLAGAARMVYDIGLEFIAPPPALRQLLSPSGARTAEPIHRARVPEVVIRQRRYVPRLERESAQDLSWHLIVDVEGNACFSGRFATRREALGAWERFQRQRAHSRRAPVTTGARPARRAARRR